MLQTYYIIGRTLRKQRENILRAQPTFCKRCQEFMTQVDKWETGCGIAEAFECKKCGRAVNAEIISSGIPVTVANIVAFPEEFENEYVLIRRGEGSE